MSAASVALREASLNATLTAVATTDATALATVNEVNDEPVSAFPTITTVTIDFAGITPRIDRVVPIDPSFLAVGQPVRAFGSFTSATGFRVTRLFILGAVHLQGTAGGVDDSASRVELDLGRLMLRDVL